MILKIVRIALLWFQAWTDFAILSIGYYSAMDWSILSRYLEILAVSVL